MSLINALNNYGLIVSEIIADGNLHRVPTVRKPRSKNGWYVAFENGIACSFGNWENGDGRQHWQDDNITEAQRFSVRISIEAFEKKQAERREGAADEAIKYIESCSKDGFSDYLKNKRIYPHGVKFDTGCIIIPCQDSDGKIWSYQKIYGDGSKYFLADGRTKGCYYLISGRNINKDELVVVCEGFATGASIYQKTGLPVVVCFYASNLKPVCDSLLFRNIIIAADNDKSGVGEKYAKESGYKYVMPEVEGWDFSDLYINDREIAPYFIIQSSETPELTPHGLVGEIADWITSTAIRPQPLLSISAAMTFVGMLKGHIYATSTDLRTNILTLNLAPSGGGKEHPQNCLLRLVESCNLSQRLLAEPVSGTGFLTGLMKAERIGLLVLDEIGRYLSNAMDKRSGSFQKEIVDYIIKSFSKANSTLMGRQYGDEKKNPRIDIKQPHFCCFGSTVKEKIISACRSTDAIDGFLNRWIVFDVASREREKDIINNKEVPQSIIDKVSALPKPEYDIYGTSKPIKTNYSPEAAEIMQKFRDEMENKILKSEYPLNTLYSRSTEHAAKIATIMAADELILSSDVRFSIKVVEQSNNAILKFAGMISDNDFEADYIRIRELILKYKTIKRNILTRKTQFIHGGEKRRAEIIQTLIDNNIICAQILGKEITYKAIM